LTNSSFATKKQKKILENTPPITQNQLHPYCRGGRPMFYAWVVFLGFCLLVSCTLVFWFAFIYDLFCSFFWLGFGLGLLDSCFFISLIVVAFGWGLFAFLFALFGGVIWFGMLLSYCFVIWWGWWVYGCLYWDMLKGGVGGKGYLF
jgi:hypothetical protein